MNTQTTNPRKRIRLIISALALSFLLSRCFLTQDRTTVVYGTITDQNGEPVDSILVSVDVGRAFKYETLMQVYSGEDGSYELVVDVPRKYRLAYLNIPPDSYDNPKYDKSYKGLRTYKNGQFTEHCCSASIGNKTKYDFQLIPR
jgi:hypothetical protein